jgi:hypothetical protein
MVNRTAAEAHGGILPLDFLEMPAGRAAFTEDERVREPVEISADSLPT